MNAGDRVCFCRSGLCGTIIMVASGDIISPPYTIYGDDGRFYTAYNEDIMIISNNEDDKQ